jgi:hypothetical protein
MLFHIDPASVADDGDELSIQINLRKELKKRAPAVAFVAVPNGAQRTAWASIKAKQEGLQSGFPDGLLIWKCGIAFAEIKTRTGVLSEQQHVWLNFLTKAGFPCGVFRSANSCIGWLAGLGAPVDTAKAGQNFPGHVAIIQALLNVAVGSRSKSETEDAIELARAYLGGLEAMAA